MNSSRRIVCFGELLLRLSAPDSQLLLQTPRLDVAYGGAEANVAVSLARLGGDATMISILPDNRLGRAARDELRRHGVDTSALLFRPGRMGLYFLSPGAVLRPSEVTYDRSESTFALADPGAIDWDGVLNGAAWLHLSGVTPAVSPQGAAAASLAVRAARRQRVSVSFDGNYRAKLWSVWKGDGPAVVRDLLEHADLAFADDRDIALALGRTFDGDAQDRRQAAAAAAFEAFPHLNRMAFTVRSQQAVEDHELGAGLFTRDASLTAPARSLQGVVDRIGGGDAFAAGMLHGISSGMDDQGSLEFALAAACLKHSIPGDFNLASVPDVLALLSDDGLDVKR